MREPVRDNGRLEHILEAIHYVEAFTKGFTYDDLLADALHLHAVVHDYYQIDFDILWDVINKDLPVLKAQVEDYLR